MKRIRRCHLERARNHFFLVPRFAWGVILIAPFGALAQGNLAPSGAPGPTMKALDQIQPRVIVNSNNTPGDAISLFKITQPGSYYLTGNITGVSNLHGITVAAPHVTLDLSGFALLGVPGSLDGINATSSPPLAAGLRVHDGKIAGWGGSGVNAQPGAPGAEFSKLWLLTNALNGLKATSALITECVAEGNTSGSFTNYAINANAGSRIINCIARTNYNGIQGAGGSVIEGCTSRDSAFGILAGDSAILHCAVYNNSDGMYLFNNCRVIGNLIDGNGNGKGIEVAGGSSGNTLDGNTLVGNAAAGITLANSGVSNNFVIRNCVHGSGASAYLTGSGNSFGPIVNVAGSNDISTVSNASHPWANFSY